MVALAFSPADSFALGQVKANQEVVAAACQVVLGRPVRIRCTVEDDSGNSSTAAAGGKRPPKQQVDPAVKSVLDTFDGELV